MEIFGSHLKKQKKEEANQELQVVYTCDKYLKLLSFKTNQSVTIFKNPKEISAMCIIQ